MSSTQSWKRMSILPVIVMLSLLAVLAAQQDPGTAVTLAYKFPEGKTISYRQSSTEKQFMQVGGQDVNTVTQASLEFTAKPKETKESAFGISVTIDGMKLNVQGPQGDLTPDLSQILGKGFDMTLSRLGKEIDTSGAAVLKYQVGPSGSRDLAASFQTFFPDLPDRPVKLGDTWPSQDTVSQNTGNGEIFITTKSVHTVDGFETVDGYECARIKTAITGTLKGNFEEGGVGLTLDGTIAGSGSWHFAVKEGLLVRADSKGGISGTITAGEPANLSIPLSGESVEEVRLVKK